jgi:hypothetical protein
MSILTDTEEVSCPTCKKPFTFTVLPIKAECSGGLWVWRRLK